MTTEGRSGGGRDGRRGGKAGRGGKGRSGPPKRRSERPGGPPKRREERPGGPPKRREERPGGPPKRREERPARPGERRALSNVGGPARVEGDPALGELLRAAIEDLDAREPDDLTHGFHAYPAGMHPSIAATLVDGLGQNTSLVLDPFCGGGTVLVECRVAGARAMGVDLNPLALRIAEVRCDRRDGPSREAFLERLGAVAEASEARVRGRVDVRAPLSREQASWWQPHVLKELAGLREEIRAVDDERDRRALEVVLSSIVVKFSRQRADTSERPADKRIRKGLCTEVFARKGRELAERWAVLDESAPDGAPTPRLREGDARELPKILGRRRAELIVTSPPYGGTYDYVTHHARRFPWLGIDGRRLGRGELGARRDLGGKAGAGRWDAQMRASLEAMAASVKPGGLVVLLLGDAQLGRRRVAADEQVARLTAEGPLKVVAAASQQRADWTGGEPRREHLVALRRA